MSKKRLSEKELVEGMTPYTAHVDELGLELSEGDELERLAVLVEEYEEKHFPI